MNGPTEIKYQRAKFTRRLFANLIDLLIMAFFGICCFLAVRGIYQLTTSYQENEDRLTEMRLESSLYKEKDGQIVDISGYIDTDETLTGASKARAAEEAIDNFIEYAYAVEGVEVGDEIQNDYDDFRLSKTHVNQPYFIEEEGQIVANPGCRASWTQYFDNVYRPFIDEHCQGYLVTRFDEYLDLTRYISHILVFVEIPISYAVAGILTYLVPTFIFQRGRKTFGKAIYRIGTVDARMLNPTWKRSLSRFAIFYFAILILSLFTFAIPAIISVTLMGFSKKKQGFADYLLDLQEIDTTNTPVFKTIEEAEVYGADVNKKPIEFEAIIRE